MDQFDKDVSKSKYQLVKQFQENFIVIMHEVYLSENEVQSIENTSVEKGVWKSNPDNF